MTILCLLVLLGLLLLALTWCLGWSVGRRSGCRSQGLAQQQAELSEQLLRSAAWLVSRSTASGVLDTDRGRLAVGAAIFIDKARQFVPAAGGEAFIPRRVPNLRSEQIAALASAIGKRNDARSTIL